jgi:hypothetical protein
LPNLALVKTVENQVRSIDPLVPAAFATLMIIIDEEKLRGFFQGIMDELMRKEVLYEPLKELNGKVSEAMQTSQTTLSESLHLRARSSLITWHPYRLMLRRSTLSVIDLNNGS